MSPSAHKPVTTVEATVTSKGQVTLPRELRQRLGIQKGSRIRFSIPAKGAARVEPLLYDLEDLWKMANQTCGTGKIMTFAEMDKTKSKRQW